MNVLRTLAGGIVLLNQGTTEAVSIVNTDFAAAVVILSLSFVVLIVILLLTISYGKRRENQQDLEEKSEKLAYMTNHDVVTGLANRNHLMSEVQEKLLSQGSDFSALYNIDVVNLKTINDAYGHDVGDKVLLHVATIIREFFCVTDDHIGVYHTEFFVYDIDVAGLDEVRHRVSQLLRRLIHTTLIDHMEINIKANIGIAVAPEHSLEARLLLKKANIAMVESTKYGPNHYRIFKDTLYMDVLKRITLEKQLRRAIVKEEMEIYYQPRIDMNDLTVGGCEALIRWHHPDGKLVYPNHFIPLAESVGFINEITRWVASKVARQVVEWEAMGCPVKISFNISGKEFDEEFVKMMANIVEDQDVSPGLLEVEITETAALTDMENSRLLVDALRNIGVSVALDDFGTGYSSMTYIKNLKASKLKIDRTFIVDIHEEEQRVVMESMIQLGQRLNYSINVEGIETREQMDILKDMNVDEVQGWYFSKAIPADEFIQYVRNRNGSMLQ